MKKHYSFFVDAIALALGLWVTPTMAQQAIQLDEVVVTAERRVANLQEVPISVEVYSAAAIAARHVLSLDELSTLSPSLFIERSGPQGYVFIRGVGNTSVGTGTDGSTAVYMDDVYQSRPASALADFYDLERIEVLKGPQGTLYGRNATGGAILVKSKRPLLGSHGFDGKLSYGNFDRVRAEANANFPVGDNAAFRLSGLYGDDTGYRRNLFNGGKLEDRQVKAGRAQLLLKFGEWNVNFAVDHMESKGSHGVTYKLDDTQPAPIIAFFGAQIPSNPYEDYYDSPNFSGTKFTGGVMTVDGMLGSMAFKSITGYRKTEQNRSIDLDSTAINFAATEFGDEMSKAFSQDLQLSNAVPSKLDWVAGLSYFDDALTTRVFAAVYPFAITVDNGTKNNAKSFAAFGEAKYHLTDSWGLIAGLRYTHEKKDQLFNTVTPNPVFDDNSWSSVTPKVGVEYKAGSYLLYGTVTNGFKSGGFNANAVQPPFNEEKIWSYEVGAKTAWLENRLVANFSAFFYDYTDLQVSQIILPNPVPIIVNAGKAKVYGLEGDIMARPINNLSLNFGFALLKTKYGSLELANDAIVGSPVQSVDGNQFSRAPKMTVSAGADYVIPLSIGSIDVGVSANHRSRVYFSAFEDRIVSQKGVTLIDARLAWKLKNWQLALYGRNLTDEFYKSEISASPSFTGTQYLVAEPRSFGFSVSFAY